MRYPPGCYQMGAAPARHLGHLRPARRRGPSMRRARLALWVHGTVLAGSACQSAVIAALVALGRWHGVRQYPREWTRDGADSASRPT